MPRALTWTQEVIRHSFLSLQADLQRRKDHCWLKAPSGWTHSPYLDPQISSDFLTFSALNKLLLQISWQIELLRIISGPVMSTAELECPAMDSFCSLCSDAARTFHTFKPTGPRGLAETPGWRIFLFRTIYNFCQRCKMQGFIPKFIRCENWHVEDEEQRGARSL